MSLMLGIPALLLSAVAHDEACAAVPGWADVLARPNSQFIILGELHGTAESPDLFGDAVCLTALSRNVVVGLEMPTRDQAAIDRFLASDGGAEAQDDLLSSPFWSAQLKDGRQSEAQFSLLDYLRRLKAAGRIQGVVAFQPSELRAASSNTEYEQAMAGILIAARDPETTMIALVGKVHARTGAMPFGDGYRPMAAFLPVGATVTFDIIGDGGTFWSCIGEVDGCGANAFPYRGSRHMAGIQFSSDLDDPYTGRIFLGRTTTASPPKVP